MIFFYVVNKMNYLKCLPSVFSQKDSNVTKKIALTHLLSNTTEKKISLPYERILYDFTKERRRS